MKRTIQAAALITTAATQAHATDWIIIDASKAVCASATGGMAPLPLEQALRQDAHFDSTTVLRDDKGAVVHVIVKSNYGIEMHFFTTRALCEAERTRMLKTGQIHDPKELQ